MSRPPGYIQQLADGSYRVRIAQNGKEWSRRYRDRAAAECALEAKRKEGGTGGIGQPGETPPAPDGQRDVVEGNQRYVETKGETVRTLEDLIAVCHIDTAQWRIAKWEANKWEVGAKDAYGNIVVTPLFQVKAWMVKRDPVPILPIIKPVCFTLSPLPQPAAVVATAPKTIILAGDLQCGYRRHPRTGHLDPFHDRRALDILVQVVETLRPDALYWMGDLFDATEFTDKFVREPSFYFTMQPAVIELAWWLARCRPFVTHNYLYAGNHDIRLRTALMQNLLAVYDLKPAQELDLAAPLSLERLLGLRNLGIGYVGDYPAEAWLADNLRAEHGELARTDPGASAAAVVDRVCANTVFFHIHRRERATRTESRRGIPHTITAVCPGCLCRVDGVVPGHQLGQHWQQGFAVAHVDGDYVAIDTVEIQDGTAYYNGKTYRGRDVLPQLVRDVGDGWGF